MPARAVVLIATVISHLNRLEVFQNLPCFFSSIIHITSDFFSIVSLYIWNILGGGTESSATPLVTVFQFEFSSLTNRHLSVKRYFIQRLIYPPTPPLCSHFQNNLMFLVILFFSNPDTYKQPIHLSPELCQLLLSESRVGILTHDLPFLEPNWVSLSFSKRSIHSLFFILSHNLHTTCE